MTNITNFNFKDSNLRTITINDNPYFCVADLRNILNIEQRSSIIQDLKKGFIKNEALTDGGKQQVYFCSEKDLYKITLRSNSKVAEPFQDWVCGEVLPQLRKTGSYNLNPSKTTELNQNTTTQKELNTINLNDFENWQYFYMNDILLSFPYFRYKINKDTGLPLINIEDFAKCIGFKNFILEMHEKNSDTLEFNKIYSMIPTDTSTETLTLKDYCENFRQAFKKASEIKLLQLLNNPLQLEDYEQTPAVADYMNLIGNEKLLTATEIGAMLGISGCMVGKIANRLNMKIEKFGAWFRDKAAHSIKEVQTFKYNNQALNEFKKFLGIKNIKMIEA